MSGQDYFSNTLSVFFGGVLTILLFVGCSNSPRSSKEENNEKSSILMSIPQDSSLTTYEAYRNFDEYSMSEISTNDSTKNVMVARNDSCILVKWIGKKDSTVCYRRYGNTWINVVVLEWEKRHEHLIKDGYDEPARIFYRMIRNDSIIELEYYVIADAINKELYIKTRKECTKILLSENDVMNMSNPFPELRILIDQYNSQPEEFLSSEESHKQRKKCEYIVSKKNDQVVYSRKDGQDEYVYKVSYLERFGMPPGLIKIETWDSSRNLLFW